MPAKKAAKKVSRQGPAHWPKANAAKTACTVCGRPIARAGSSWRHVKYEGRGRPPTPPRMPTVAANAVADWHAAMDLIKDGESMRRDAFRRMAESGMVAAQIAEVTGLTPPGVSYLSKTFRIPLRNLEKEGSRSVLPSLGGVEKALRDRKGGSVLFES